MFAVCGGIVMKASEHLRAAVHEIEKNLSPWRPGLSQQLRHLIVAAVQHESWVDPAPEELVSSVVAPVVDAAAACLDGG